MVSFDQRYRSAHKGYSRERVKRDTETTLARDLYPRELPELGDRGVAGLIFRDVATGARIPDPNLQARVLESVARAQPHFGRTPPLREKLDFLDLEAAVPAEAPVESVGFFGRLWAGARRLFR